MKMSLIKLAMLAWLRVMITYLVITLFSMVFPIMYLISAGLALLWSLPAVVLLIGVLHLMKAYTCRKQMVMPLLLGCMFLLVLGSTILAAHHISNGNDTWDCYRGFIIFPACAFLAGIAGIVTMKEKLVLFFTTVSGVNTSTDSILIQIPGVYED